GERVLPLGARPAARHEHAPPPSPPPPSPPPRVRHALTRGRRGPAHDPGAARPQLALDDADLQPRGRPPPAQGLRPRPPPLLRKPSNAVHQLVDGTAHFRRDHGTNSCRCQTP